MVRQQRTIAEAFTLAGRGLHTGKAVELTFKPAAPDTGIRFVRTDLERPVEIPANVGRVSKRSAPSRNTSLTQGNTVIHTVEHLLAACYGLRIDNLRIEISADEPPEPEDGNYQFFVKPFNKVGMVSQGSPCDVLEIDTPVTYRNGDVEIVALPSETFRVSFTIQYANKHIGTQYASFEVTPEVFEKEISPARTFILAEDVEKLRETGMIKGGSLNNAIVFGENGLVNKEPMRFADECVRHKVLDLLGDLALLGVPLKGHVHAVKSGHMSNIRFVNELWRFKENKMRDRASLEAGQWDINLIQQIMPHRYPFLLVDKILELEDRKRVVGIKNVTINEPFFAGHFPGHAIMPAVLIIEAMAQAGGVMLLNTVDNPKNYLVYFTRIDKARFRKPVLPGDQLRFELEMVALKMRVCKMQGYAYVGDDLVAEAELLANIVER
ncbi:MAG: bifunctional UDP-3-O-[3-hydroxymyristoyl] N-acetylglucosamine deacetylase/3-hydroxyacyl-ACP dehydratase [Candidatus Latescibacterota bacterium]|nr:MAG: bifunctional UDP-3-O-[3-hydroxymyristoyl] N-acetylglucosamine deacetylase/3-hydroxyacyl-ACP dehydratase [Candidatus Latescibacterota bacterium]